MSTDEGPDRAPGFVPLGQDDQGRQMLGMPYNEGMAQKALENELAEQLQPKAGEDDPDDNEGDTPAPNVEADSYQGGGGPIRRFNDVFTDLGSVQLEAMGMDGYEVASAAATLRDEMYRSQFPIIQPRFVVKCVDDQCGADYDNDLEFCLQCARREMSQDGVENPPTDPDEVPEEYRDHPVRRPSPTEKREAFRLTESVNKEGQSLRELMKSLEDDQSRLGISTMVVKKSYVVAGGDTVAYDRGNIIHEDVDELLRGDPKRIVPVVDENGRVGNWKYTCPVHRKNQTVSNEEYEEGDVHCEECGAERREIFFVEQEGGRHNRNAQNRKYYFEDEIITWARYYPRLHGLDGLSPLHHVWLKQAILHWMDIYGSAFYDPQSDKYPNKFMVVHTTNPKAWEKQFDKAEEDSRENPYSQQIMFNEYSGESNTTPEVQVIDLMNDELLGQDQQIKDQYKQDIRANYGVTNIFDSELEDAGGLNNEGLQLEVTDRSVATAIHDTVAGPLDELAKTLGIEDYKFEFIPPRETDVDKLREHIKTGKKAANAGLDARLEDEKVEVSDGDFEEEDGEGGGLGGLFGAGDFDGDETAVDQKADPMINGHQFDPATGEGDCESTGKAISAETMGDLEQDCPHCGEPMSVFGTEHHGGESRKAEVDAVRLTFGPGGEVIDHDEDDWGGFLDDLAEHGTPFQMWKGLQRHPDDDLESHDHDTYVALEAGHDAGDVEAVLEDHPGCHYSIAGDSVSSMDRPDDWDPEGSEHVLTKADARPDAAPEAAETADARDGVESGTRAKREPGRSRHESDVVRALANKADGDVDVFHIEADDDDDMFDTGDTLAWGVEFPNSGVYVDWNVDAWPDDEQLDGPHVSDYETIDDAKKVAQGTIVFEGDDSGNPNSPDREKMEQVRALDDAFKHIVWADETNKAEPFWDEDETVPEFVLEKIAEVVDRAVMNHIESIPGNIESRLAELLAENLTQPQGWSLGSITEDIVSTFGVDRDDAELVARTETANVLNEAREEGYRDAGALDDEEDPALFRWIGPQDHRTTDACEWLKKQTEDGVTFDRLIELEKEATDEFFDELGFRKHTIHPNERHTFVEHFKADVPHAGPIQVEYDYDISPAVAGTFKPVA